MSKETAVQWLIDYVHSDLYQKSFGQTYISIELVQQALAMEKEQIVDAYDNGYDLRDDMGSLSSNPKGEQYYNETYHSVEPNEMIDHIGDANEMVDQVPDVRKMVEEYGATCNQLYKEWLKIGFEAGYNKAKETLYTEEQIREAVNMARKDNSPLFLWDFTIDEIIQSLKQPKQ